MRRYDARFKRNAELIQQLTSFFHNRSIRLTAHDHADFGRFTVRG